MTTLLEPMETAAETATAAYRLTTDAAILQARPWQQRLYAALSDPNSDAGYLLTAPGGAGKTEAVVIPTLGLHRGGSPHRVFLIGADGSTLDDHLYRLVPYLRNSATADEMPRAIYVDTPEDEESGQACRRFFPDGAEDPAVMTNPLEADVDLVLTTFSRFRDLFFGSGGIHALPSTFGTNDQVRRDLFFFDDAQGYGTESFARFHRTVEFLFAEDTDIVVASATMPAAFQEELNFLETIAVGLEQAPRVTLRFDPAGDVLGAMETAVRRHYYQNSRVFGVLETPEEAAALMARLKSGYPHSVYLYHEGQPASERRRSYAQLRELEKEGEGYLLLTTGAALETSDLDATVLLSTLCPPENLIRRVGRCNRRGDLPDAQVFVFGEAFASAARALNPTQAADYVQSLRECNGAAFDASHWQSFI